MLKFLQPLIVSIPPVEEMGHPRWQLEYTIQYQNDWRRMRQKLRGKIIPHFYGLHEVSPIYHSSPYPLPSISLQVITPSGQLARVLVLEYVEGVTLDRLARDFFPDNQPLDPQNFQRYCKNGEILVDRF
jgi:hypothetical protein